MSDEQNTHENITRFYQITSDIGTSGQPTKDQLKLIADAGYAAVINLALPTSDHAIADEGSIVSGLGMAFFHIPVDFEAPMISDVKLFFAVMRGLEGRKVWVHCVVNARVSAFCNLYLRHVRGLAGGDVRTPVLDKWEASMSEPWKDLLDQPASAFVG